MHLPDSTVEALGWMAFQFIKLQPWLPMYLHLMIAALFPIYTGSHASLTRPSSADKPLKKNKSKDEKAEEEEEDEDRIIENLSPSDVILFPILAGCTLTGLYFLIKWLNDPVLLNKILNWYFAIFSIFSVSRFVSDGFDVLHSFLLPQNYLDDGMLFKVDAKSRRATATDSKRKAERLSPLPWMFSRLPLPRFVRSLLFFMHMLPEQKLTITAFVHRILSVKVNIGLHGIIGLIVGVSTVLYYNFVSKPWFLTNLMGFAFAYGTLQILSPTTFITGTLLLSALFFYDIYFVFFTPMMVTVAQSLDIPIKLLFPRPTDPSSAEPSRAYSMLGLGDVVLPGILIGLALRFDLYLFYLRKQTKVLLSPTVEQIDAQLSLKTTDWRSSTIATSREVTKKARFVKLSETWGDRLWTCRLFGSLPTNTHAQIQPSRFPKPYFHASLIGYVLGMASTLLAMSISEHAQPALLYLVPGVVSSLWAKAWLRGEVTEMWNFSEATEEKEDTTSTEKAPEKAEHERLANNEAIADSSKQAKTSAAAGTVKVKQGSSTPSIFSNDRAEARSKAMEKATASFLDAKHARESSSEEADSEAKEGALLFSFSITSPASSWTQSSSWQDSSASTIKQGAKTSAKASVKEDIDDDDAAPFLRRRSRSQAHAVNVAQTVANDSHDDGDAQPSTPVRGWRPVTETQRAGQDTNDDEGDREGEGEAEAEAEDGTADANPDEGEEEPSTLPSRRSPRMNSRNRAAIWGAHDEKRRRVA